MAKRISMKGKGADIFFGEYPPPTPSDLPVEEIVEVNASPLEPGDNLDNQDIVSTEIKDISMQESLHARKQESLKDSMQESRNASMPSNKNKGKKAALQPQSLPDQPLAGPLAAEVLTSIWKYVSERATITNAFRYTDQELSRLTDVIYDITKRNDTKLSKQDIARLALNAVLWDYEVRGDASLLGEFVTRRKRRVTGEQ